MILITHDLGVVSKMCDDVAIVYAGEIVEIGTLRDVFKHPTHPYTKGLFDAIPDLEGDEDRLHPIDGLPPNPSALPEGCKFSPRCPHATEQCRQQAPALVSLGGKHQCRCYLAAEMKEGETV